MNILTRFFRLITEPVVTAPTPEPSAPGAMPERIYKAERRGGEWAVVKCQTSRVWNTYDGPDARLKAERVAAALNCNSRIRQLYSRSCF